ncbi:MAG: acyl-CoA dehydrogenase family protein [Candidatus Bathyarchaeota archaeon]|nr:MAG: acyl-CoA dehydrogenase family protein [Candidatus Bathyarchaeota archaeon]
MNFDLTEEQIDIKDAVRDFCEKEFTDELMREYCEREEFPWELSRKAAGLGFIGIHFPEEYGGQGYGYFENAIVTEEMIRSNPELGIPLVFADFGTELILRFGTEEQKEKYVPRIAKGEGLSAAAFTEPSGGSDISKRLETVALKDGDDFVINGSKTFITNANISDFIITICQTDPEASPPYRGQSIIIIDNDTPGIEATLLKGKLGIKPSQTCEVAFSDVRVPQENLLGELNRGFYHTVDFLNESRIEIAAQGVGIAQGALDRAVDYAKERHLFGKPLVELQVVAHKLADMAIKVEAARLLTHKAAWLADQGRPDPLISSIAKTYSARAGVEVTDEAAQIFGGYSFLDEYEIERFYRLAKIIEIYEGAKEVQKNNIARCLIRL